LLRKNNLDSSVVRCLALAVLRQHVAVALTLGFYALALTSTIVALVTATAAQHDTPANNGVGKWVS